MLESNKRPKVDSIVAKRPVLKQQYLTPSSVNLPGYVKKGAPILVQSKSDQQIVKPDPPEKADLDGFYLLENTGMGFPEDAQQAILHDRNLCGVVADDFTYFSEMLYIDVSENHLSLSPFGAFPKLRELRLTCNGITGFHEELYGFHFLLYLDLSYNKITADAVQRLWVLPELRELDLCGNNMKVLPKEMYKFAKLEKILLDYNKMEDNQVFLHLCTIPNLRHISLANNFLSAVPVESCMHGGLKLLETLDISFNYFASEDNVAPIVTLPRLLTFMLYGNPLLGPTGEDPMFIYIEKLVEKAGELRDASGSSLKDVDFLTEIPRKRTLKKGQALGRQALYRDFSVVQVDTNISTKTTKEWRKKGADSMFAEAMHTHKKPQYTVNAPVLIPDLTFLTNSIGNDNMQDEADMDAIADDVMKMVAKEMGILNSAELLRIRDKARIRPNAAYREGPIKPPVTRKPFDADENNEENDVSVDYTDNLNNSEDNEDVDQEYNNNYDNDENDGDELSSIGVGTQEGIPSAFFKHPMSDPQTFYAQPVSVKTAMKALQLALKQPLTNYDEVPSKFSSLSKDYVRTTAASRNRQLPRQVRKVTTTDVDEDDNHDLDKKDPKHHKKGISEPVALKAIRLEQREFTLTQIDQVLDSLNENTNEFTSPQRRHIEENQGGSNNAANSNKDTMNSMKYFARPYHGLKNLMDMVDEVEEEFRK